MKQLLPELTKHGVELFPVASSRSILFYRGLLRLLKNARWKRVRFVILNSSAVLRKKRTLKFLKIAKLLKLPVFIYFHESSYQLEQLEKMFPKEAYRVRRFLNDPYVHIWANSEFTRHDNAVHVKGSFDVVHNGVTIETALLPRSAEHLKLFPPTVIQLGLVEELKDWEIFIETAKFVVKKVPTAQFVWLGEGHDRKKALSKVQSMGLSDNVFFPGFMSNPELMFRNAHLFFQTSIRESFSLTTAQAMAYGKEVVMFKGVGGAEEVAGGLADVIDKREPCMAAERIIERLKQEPVLRVDMMDRFQSLYSIERHAERVALAIMKHLK